MSIAPGAHPPIIAGAVVSPVHAQSNWPTVIGVLSMVLGTLAALNALSTLFFGILGPWLFDAIGISKDPQFAASFQSTRDNVLLIAINGVVSLFLGVLLAFAGLRIIQRRASGVRLSRIWAWSKIAFSVFGSATGAYISLSQLDSTKQQMAAPGVPAFVVNILGPTMIVLIFLSFLWLLAYPVFTLIWFRRAGVRQTVATWPK